MASAANAEVRAAMRDMVRMARRLDELEQLEGLAVAYEQAVRDIDEPPPDTKTADLMRAAVERDEALRTWVRRHRGRGAVELADPTAGVGGNDATGS